MKKGTEDSWTFDDMLVEFFNAAKERRANLSKDTQTLFRKNKASFLTELRRQAVRRAYSGQIQLSEHDYNLGIYYNVVRRAIDKKHGGAAREILAPAVRALMTDEDPEGRQYLTSVDDVGLLCQILVLCLRTDFEDGIWAFLSMLLLSHWDGIETDFDDGDWRIIASAAGRLGRYGLAAFAFLRAAKLDREPERRSESYFDASRGVLFRLREKPKSPAECRFLQKIVDDCRDNLDEVAQFRALSGLLGVWTASRSGGDTVVAAAELFHAAERTAEEWDSELDGANSPLASSELAVKAPLEWQSHIACLAGNLEQQIDAFPTPLYADGDRRSLQPAASHVNGVRVWDIWEGLALDLPDTFRKVVPVLSQGTETVLKDIPPLPIQQTGPKLVDDYLVAQSVNRNACDISILSVAVRDVGGRKRRPEMFFPFPSKEFRGNAANANGRPWEYFVWRHGVAADVRVELQSGLHLCATMPFFVGDVPILVRGLSYSLFLAAFPLSFKKAASQKEGGSIAPAGGHSFFTHASADIVGRVVSVAPATLWNGDKVLKFMLRVGGLTFDLPAFVSCKTVEDGAPDGESFPVEGDMVECRAWMMVDFRAEEESREAFIADNPEGVRVKPVPVADPDGRDDGTFLLECHVAGTSRVDDVKGKTAELQKDSPLFLRREPGNEYDRDAIAIYTAEENRIGYVPQQHNPILSRLLDSGRDLVGKVVSREVVNDFVRMRMCIFLR